MPDMDLINQLSRKYRIPFFFDASHSFGVENDGVSALSHGAASTISFHATKIFSTIEGGALITNSDELANKARSWRNFGIKEGKITNPGINGKMSEFHALFGIQSLKIVEREIKRRKSLLEKYKQLFDDSEIEVVDSPNASYAPIIFKSEQTLLKAEEVLIKNGITPRRYFFPSLDTLDFLPLASEAICSNSRDISKRILCLPIGKDVSDRVAKKIASLLLEEVDRAEN
jgi:dTDP-4-amino-4,6-dideoxygalactose transaminase